MLVEEGGGGGEDFGLGVGREPVAFVGEEVEGVGDVETGEKVVEGVGKGGRDEGVGGAVEDEGWGGNGRWLGIPRVG